MLETMTVGVCNRWLGGLMGEKRRVTWKMGAGESGWITGGDDKDALNAKRPDADKGTMMHDGAMAVVLKEGRERRTRNANHCEIYGKTERAEELGRRT
jgi:hypothetical protein